MTRQVVIGAVLGFVATAILLTVWGRSAAPPEPPRDAGAPTAAQPRPRQEGEPLPLPEAKVHVLRPPLYFIGADGGT